MRVGSKIVVAYTPLRARLQVPDSFGPHFNQKLFQSTSKFNLEDTHLLLYIIIYCRCSLISTELEEIKQSSMATALNGCLLSSTTMMSVFLHAFRAESSPPERWSCQESMLSHLYPHIRVEEHRLCSGQMACPTTHQILARISQLVGVCSQSHNEGQYRSR
jgi:hypothetical protein